MLNYYDYSRHIIIQRDHKIRNTLVFKIRVLYTIRVALFCSLKISIYTLKLFSNFSSLFLKKLTQL